jgi:hypothetical protein
VCVDLIKKIISDCWLGFRGDDIVRGANHPPSLAVLWRRHAQLNTPREEGAGGVIELAPVVTLDNLNGEAELSGHPGKEVEEGEKGSLT